MPPPAGRVEGAMTLDEAVAHALRNNPRIAGAAAQVRAARARITQRRALRRPQFGVNNFVFRQGPVVSGSTGNGGGGGAGGNGSNRRGGTRGIPGDPGDPGDPDGPGNGGPDGPDGPGDGGQGGPGDGGQDGDGSGGDFGGGFSSSPWRWNVGVFVNQIIFDWGQREARQRVAEREADANRARLAETENDVRLVVSTAFYNVFRAQELLRVAQERRTAAAEQLRVARARFGADVAPRFDVIRSEAELAAAEQEVIEAENDVALSEAAFNTALGRDVITPVALQETPQPTQTDFAFERLRTAALRNRPQLSALRFEVEAGRQEVRARRAENNPQVSLSAAYDRPSPGGFNSTSYRYNVGLVMTWPFFDSGLTRGRVREAQANVDVDRQFLEENRQQVELDVRQAQLDIREARQRIVTAEREVASAREALRIAEVRYRAGVGTTIEVTDAQVAFARAGQNLANARFDYGAAISRLENATGVPIEVLQLPGPAPLQ
jgi:outer membrane protein